MVSSELGFTTNCSVGGGDRTGLSSNSFISSFTILSSFFHQAKHEDARFFYEDMKELVEIRDGERETYLFDGKKRTNLVVRRHFCHRY